MIVAGGGVHYSGAEERAARCSATPPASRSGESQAGKGSLPHGHPQEMGAVGSTGTTAANALARTADVVIGIGTRWSDFTTASRTAFQAGRRAVREHQHRELRRRQARRALRGRRCPRGPDRPDRRRWTGYVGRRRLPRRAGRRCGRPGTRRSRRPTTRRRRSPTSWPTGLLTQGTVLGCVNELSDPRDVVLCAAGSMPGDLHKLWRVRDRKGYHVEYGYSCMGYEVPASLGIRLADETRDVFAMVGDGGYLMMPTELVTAVQERIKVIVVLVQNHGFHSIGSLSEELGSQRFGTSYRYRDEETGRLDGDVLPVDLAANARSLGVHVIEVTSRDELEKAIRQAKEAPGDGGPILIHVQTDPLVHAPDSESWWDVPGQPGLRARVDPATPTSATSTTRPRQQPFLRPPPPTVPGGES